MPTAPGRHPIDLQWNPPRAHLPTLPNGVSHELLANKGLKAAERHLDPPAMGMGKADMVARLVGAVVWDGSRGDR